MSRPRDTRPVRAEDAFDEAAVTAWLREHAVDSSGVEGIPEVHQFSGGASNLTFLLRYPPSGDREGRDLILRRAPRGTKARGAHDMRREHTIQSALSATFPYVPGMVAFCDDATVLGGDFYVMDRIDGVIPRSEWPGDVPLPPDRARALCLAAVDVLAELHAVDPAEAGLEGLGRGAGYVRRQVEGWSTRYRNARTDDVPDLERVMAWLDRRQPDDVAACVIHNDFKLDNLVLDRADPTRVVGVLDWEMATVGDPLMDLAGSMAYWVQADDPEDFQLMRRVPTHLPGMLTRDEVVSAYAERTGRTVTADQWRFYEVFGLFRLAVIAQQIYYRYVHGQTTNEAYAVFGPAVQIVGRRLDGLVGDPDGAGPVGDS